MIKCLTVIGEDHATVLIAEICIFQQNVHIAKKNQYIQLENYKQIEKD
jgi:hypothetical protein